MLCEPVESRDLCLLAATGGSAGYAHHDPELPPPCVLLFMGISCASAGTMIPDTLAGSVLRAWLSAFNSGNPSLITRDVLPLNPYQSLPMPAADPWRPL